VYRLKVSIILPVRNEESYIADCVRQIVNQTYPKDKMQILIVDGMSEDKTREIIGNFINSNNKVSIKLLNNEEKQRASALNIGIKEAEGDVIMRIDARTIILPDYVERCIDTLIETKADNVGGIQKPIVARGAKSFTQKAVALALSHFFGVGNAHFRIGKKSGYVDTVYPGCFRREVFEKVGFFDEKSAVISEDADINYRIRRFGGKIYCNKDIIAYYYPRDNFRDLWRLYLRYGGAKAGNLISRGKLTAGRQSIPPIFLLTLILLPILGIFYNILFYIWLLIGISYILIDIFVSLYLVLKCEIEEKIRHPLSLFWRLLFVFPIIHFSWSIGFWLRLLQRPKVGQYWAY